MCSKACARVARHVVSIGAALKVDATYVPLEADATYVQLPNYQKKKFQEKLQRMCHWRRMQLSATYVPLPNCVPTRGGCAVCAVCAILIALITTEVPLQGLMELVDLDACLRMPVPR